MLKNKEAFCAEVMPLYRSKLEEIERQIIELSQIRLNLQQRMAAVQQERMETGLSGQGASGLEANVE
ncbi:hypothetical protein D3C75_1147380 [compost metagenome]